MWGCNNTNCVFIPEHNTACYHVNINLTSGARKKSVILISAAGQQSVIWSTKLLYAESKAMTRWKLPQSWSSKAGTRSGDITDRNHNHHPTQHPMTTEQEAWERGRGLGVKQQTKREEGGGSWRGTADRWWVSWVLIKYKEQQEESKERKRGALTCPHAYTPSYEWNTWRYEWKHTHVDEQCFLQHHYQPIPDSGLNREGGPCWGVCVNDFAAKTMK